MDKNRKKEIINATKWSSITEIIAKLVAPISNIILARLLTPEMFGVVATATMIFSFADMFTDSGFQKYLVQHDFSNDKEKYESALVAFWTNLMLSIFFLIVISIFSSQLAVLVGNPGMGNVFIISCISLPLTSFSSIQIALFHRNFDFKTLFYVRLASILTPFFVTVPLAFIWHNYWALIIGTICGNLSNSIILMIKSEWKPNLYFNFVLLKQMLSFSLWSLVEAILIWLASYIGVFIVGKYLNTYYLGLYKTSMSTVNSIISLVTSATTPVLFSSLSRLQDNKVEFKKTFFSFQRYVGLLIIPMGIGIFVYRQLVTNILLGSQWEQAKDFIGLWALVSVIKVLLSNYCSEVYRALGKPKISVIVQGAQIIFLIPLLIYGAKRGFQTLYILNSLAMFEMIIMNLIVLKTIINISPLAMIQNISPFLCVSVIMGTVVKVFQDFSTNIAWEIFSIVLCVLIYFGVLFSLFPKTRKEMFPFLKESVEYLCKKIQKSN